MKEKNDYGMYSGAFIFDILDREALKYVKEQAQLPKKAVLVTEQASISFRRQLCRKKYITISHSYHEVQLFSTLYYCIVDVYDIDNKLVASANFTFTLATNHCEVR